MLTREGSSAERSRGRFSRRHVALTSGIHRYLVPIMQNVRGGSSMVAHPMNLVLAVAILIAIAMTWGALLVDQIPCFLGVPNCD